MQRGRLPVEGGMEKKRHERWLSGTDYILVEITKIGGRLAKVFVAQIAEVDGVPHQVARYDNCHGRLHRHLLYDRRENREEPFPETGDKDVFRVIDELKENWKWRRNKYLWKIGRGDLIEKPTD